MVVKASSRSGFGPRTFSTCGRSSHVGALDRGHAAGVGAGNLRVAENRDPREFLHQLLEQGHLPNGAFGVVVGDAGDVRARAFQRRRNADRDRIGHQGHHDRYRRRGLSCRGCRWAADGDEDADTLFHQLSREARQAVELPFGEARLVDDMGAFDIAEFRHALLDLVEMCSGFAVDHGTRVEERAHPVDLAGGLGARHNTSQSQAKGGGRIRSRVSAHRR